MSRNFGVFLLSALLLVGAPGTTLYQGALSPVAAYAQEVPGPAPAPEPPPMPPPMPPPLPGPYFPPPQPPPPPPPPEPRPLPVVPAVQHTRQPMSTGRTAVVAICVSSGNLSGECLSSGMRSATITLASMFINTYRKSVLMGALKVAFPEATAEATAIKVLYKIEKQAINIATTQMRSDVAKITPYYYDSEQVREEKQAVVESDNQHVEQFQQQAQQDADSGSTTTYDSDSSTGTIGCGNACQQLQQINITGSWGAN